MGTSKRVQGVSLPVIMKQLILELWRNHSLEVLNLKNSFLRNRNTHCCSLSLIDSVCCAETSFPCNYLPLTHFAQAETSPEAGEGALQGSENRTAVLDLRSMRAMLADTP